ncbi:hypothetical protein DPMN_187781, partial [Dreissena polymorpha]
MHNFEDTNHKKSEVDLKITTSPIEEMNCLMQTIAEQTHEDDPDKMQQKKYEAEETFDIDPNNYLRTESKRLPLANATVTYTTFAENNSSPNETRQSDTHSDDQSIELEKKTNHIDVTDEAGNVIVELLHESLVEVHRGSLLELTWQIRGVHISKVHLIKNGERIQQKVGMSVHKADEIVFLRIASVSDVDEGDYTIQVENVTIEAAGKTSVRIVSTETENFPVNEEECNSAPRIEIKFSESSSVNLVKVNAAESFEDELNHASVDTDDELDLLAANALRRTALVRTRTCFIYRTDI